MAGDTIDSVKAKIKRLVAPGFDLDQMKIVQELTDAHIAERCMIELLMVPTYSFWTYGAAIQDMVIYVKMLTSQKILTLDAEEWFTIKDLKRRVEFELMEQSFNDGAVRVIRREEQCVTFLGKQLEDDKSFLDYHIVAGCMLELSIL